MLTILIAETRKKKAEESTAILSSAFIDVDNVQNARFRISKS